jgi:mono/diheme cytochrome c family protein
MIRGALPLALAAAALAGCDNLAKQPKEKPYTPTAARPGDRAWPPLPPEGTVARDDRPVDPPRLDAGLLARGRERFDIYCSPCHGRVGDGRGMIVLRGFPAPPSFHSQRLREAPTRHFYDVITAGYGAMYSYAARVAPADRWAIAAFIRALQASQATPVASLPETARQDLE